MFVFYLLLHLLLMKNSLEAVKEKGQKEWFLVETEHATHSKKPQNMNPLIEIISNSGQKFEIKTVKSKKMDIDILTASNVDIDDELDQSGLPETAEIMLDDILGKGNRRIKYNMKSEETNRKDNSNSDSPDDDIGGMVNETDDTKDISEDKVDGGWSIWGLWTCDMNTGEKERVRKCNNPIPTNGGRYCLGNHNERGTCSVNGLWSEWGSWTCDKNTGERERLKECNNPSPLHGGEYCLGNHNEKGTCSVNGGWSEWGSWTYDKKIGQQGRTRQCNNPAPHIDGLSCFGKSAEVTACMVDGGWSEWGSWICDKKTGEKKRVRHCSNPSPRNGGRICLGNIDETDICMKQQPMGVLAPRLHMLDKGVDMSRRAKSPSTHKMDPIKETKLSNISRTDLVAGTGGEVDQSCNISADCLDNCKLCDATIYYRHITGNNYGFNQSAEGVQCVCKKGKCKKFVSCGWQGGHTCQECGEDHCEDDSLCQWDGVQCKGNGKTYDMILQSLSGNTMDSLSLPSAPIESTWDKKCIRDGKCYTLEPSDNNWYKCDGKCIDKETLCKGRCHIDGFPCDGKCLDKGTPCLGKCYYKMCLKDGRCLQHDGKDLRDCNGNCIEASEKCDGHCGFHHCEKEDGSCMLIDKKAQEWRSCGMTKRKCIKAHEPCNGWCELLQCEKPDGTCAWEFDDSLTELKYGECNEKCVEPLSWNSTATCEGKCYAPRGVVVEKVNDECFYKKKVYEKNSRP